MSERKTGCGGALTRALTSISSPGKLRVALVEIAGGAGAVWRRMSANEVEIEEPAVGVDLEDLEAGERGPWGLWTGMALAIVAVDLGLVGLGGGHSLAGVVLESRVWGWGWLGNDVARVRGAGEGASAGVDRRGHELLGRGRGVDLAGGVIGIGVGMAIVAGVVVALLLLVLPLLVMLVLLAIERRDLVMRQRRGTRWLAERVRVAKATVDTVAGVGVDVGVGSGGVRGGRRRRLLGLREMVRSARATKDVLVRSASRLWGRWSLCSGAHTASRVHAVHVGGCRGCRGGCWGLWRGRGGGCVGGAPPACFRPGRGTGPSLGDRRPARPARRRRRRGLCPTRRTISDKFPGLLALQQRPMLGLALGLAQGAHGLTLLSVCLRTLRTLNMFLSSCFYFYFYL